MLYYYYYYPFITTQLSSFTVQFRRRMLDCG